MFSYHGILGRWTWRIGVSSALLAWLILIFYLSSLSDEVIAAAGALPSDSIPALSGKEATRNVVGHLVLYGVLALLVQSTFRSWQNSSARPLCWPLVCGALAALYGLSDEYHQSFVPGRTMSMFDVGLDSLGSAVATFAYWAWGRITDPRTEPAGVAIGSPTSQNL